MAQQSSLGVLVFPWLPLKRKAMVGDLCFTPVTMGPASQDVPSDIGSRLSIFRRFWKDPGTGQLESGGKCAIMAQADGEPIREFPSHQWLPVLDAIEAFCFAALAANEFLPQSWFSTPYVNSSCFQSYFLGDDISVFPLRRRDFVVRSSWGYEDVVVTMPLQCAVVRQFKWKDAFLCALGAALGSDQLPEPLKDLREAIWLFNRANTDDHQGLSVQQLQQEVVMTVEAFEYLTQRRSGHEVAECVARIVEGVWTATSSTSSGLLQTSRLSGKWLARQVRDGHMNSDHTPLYYWLRELHKRRSKIVHNLEKPPENEWAWTVSEHLLMAAFVFPLIIKSILAADDLYELTQGDTVRLGVIDKLLYKDNWGPQERHGESNWSKAFRDHKDKQLRDKMAARLRELQAEGEPIIPDWDET